MRNIGGIKAGRPILRQRRSYALQGPVCERAKRFETSARRRKLQTSLRSDLGAHKDNVRNAEADGDQAKHGRDVRPDENQALTEREGRG